ncbi:MAG: hypothetical protein KAS32_16620 [Candidatus Peribacteraceae bacterium]|nr:hypothetical protein [Candidatus Peribacteraceae bacterium]
MSFINAYNKTMGHEGGYVFDPTDRGGETYKGISRRFHPTWAGWGIIDSYKPIISENTMVNTSELLDKDIDLSNSVQQFYKHHFWDVPGFNFIDIVSDRISESMFDTGVNVGTGTVCKWLQSTLNILNRDGKHYPDIAVDGGLGPISLQTLGECLKRNPMHRILTIMMIYQGGHYINIMENDTRQERFVGWFERLNINEIR